MIAGTAVIGAGPAGLLFCIAAKLRCDSPIWLFDKRESYERSHRLRMAEAPYRALAADLNDPRFDALLGFLEECRFSPRVNELEGRLSSLAAELGVRKKRLEVGAKSLTYLREHLRLTPASELIIVGADSVHSAVRRLVWPGERPVERTHQYLTRLRVSGPALPETLSPLAQVRLSKVLTSLLDYRLAGAAHAEVDLFLPASEHDRIVELGASPKKPVSLDSDLLAGLGAPLFGRIVERLLAGFGGGPCEATLLSTFKLEHRYSPAPARIVPELNATVFLVGDAAVSLPFQRGMACLARCVQSLSAIHGELLTSAITPADATSRYARDVEEARHHELGIVRARSNLVRVAREVVRVSSLLPFPLQTWILSEREAVKGSKRLTLAFWVNLIFALGAGLAAIVGLTDHALAWLTTLAYPVQLIGGVAYSAARALDVDHQRPIRATWRVQIIWLFGAGVVMAVRSHSLTTVAAGLLSWFTLGIPFIAGIYFFEWLQRRWLSRADD